VCSHPCLGTLEYTSRSSHFTVFKVREGLCVASSSQIRRINLKVYFSVVPLGANFVMRTHCGAETSRLLLSGQFHCMFLLFICSCIISLFWRGWLAIFTWLFCSGSSPTAPRQKPVSGSAHRRGPLSQRHWARLRCQGSRNPDRACIENELQANLGWGTWHQVHCIVPKGPGVLARLS